MRQPFLLCLLSMTVAFLLAAPVSLATSPADDVNDALALLRTFNTALNSDAPLSPFQNPVLIIEQQQQTREPQEPQEPQEPVSVDQVFVETFDRREEGPEARELQEGFRGLLEIVFQATEEQAADELVQELVQDLAATEALTYLDVKSSLSGPAKPGSALESLPPDQELSQTQPVDLETDLSSLEFDALLMCAQQTIDQALQVRCLSFLVETQQKDIARLLEFIDAMSAANMSGVQHNNRARTVILIVFLMFITVCLLILVTQVGRSFFSFADRPEESEVVPPHSPVPYTKSTSALIV